MAIPRRDVDDEDCASHCFCYDRCVRRYRLLASADDRRRGWLAERLHQVCDVYAIDVVSMAVGAGDTGSSADCVSDAAPRPELP